MGTINPPAASRLEEKLLHLFSPNGLLTVVGLIIVGVFLFGDTGVERRTMDTPAADHLQTSVSPLLHSGR